MARLISANFMTTLTGILTLKVAPSIAKTILKLWLRNPVKEAIGGTVIDILSCKTDNILAQKRGGRQLEEIGERIALNLIEFFERDGASVPENEKTAIGLAVADSLERADIGPDLLARQNLEPSELSKHILNRSPEQSQDFSSNGRALYARIIFECSQNIVDIASQLPHFTEQTFAEVLSREAQLLDLAKKILTEVKSIKDSSVLQNVGLEAARFEGDYRVAVVRALDKMELFGVDVSRTSQRYSLSLAYISLSLQKTAEETAGPEIEKDALSLEQALADSKRVIVKGPAGSGKTTLLHWIAVRCSSKTFTDGLEDWNTAVPFFIRLRQFAERDLPTPEEFPRVLAPSISGVMPAGWVHSHLASGSAIVLIDGVDELSQVRRGEVRDWISGLVRAYPDARFVVTTRPPAIDEGWLESDLFKELEIQPMDLQQIGMFIDHWHSAIAKEAVQAEEKAKIEALSSRLKEVVAGNRPLRTLATSPLLCAVICALHRDRNQQLPSDRIELYRACCEMLLERREIERNIRLQEYPILSYRQKVVLLQDLAFWMMLNSWSQIPFESAEKRFADRLKNMGQLGDRLGGMEIRKLFVERSGVVREPMPGQLDFTHRTFQEFMAAQASLDDGDLGLLISKAHDDQWREMIILAAGLASMKVRSQIIEGIIARGDAESHYRHQLHLVAVACLETSIELTPTLQNEIKKRLKRLVPPKIMADAKALASAGDLAVSYLKYSSAHGARTEAACIRTLSLVGGGAALAQLQGYASDWRQTVHRELLNAWDSFDRTEYARQVLSKLAPESLALLFRTCVLPSFEGVQHLPNLKQLRGVVYQPSNLSTLVGQSSMRQLSLYVSHNGKFDLTLISKLSELESFHFRLLKGPAEINLREMGSGGAVENLWLFGNESKQLKVDFGSLSSWSNLRILSLRDLQPESYGSLGDSGILELSANGLESVNLAFLQRFKKLETLKLGAFNVGELDPNLVRTDLLNLDLTNGLGDEKLPPSFDLCSKLRTLKIRNWLGLKDISTLDSLQSLRTLDLSNLPSLRDLSVVNALRNLRRLSLQSVGGINLAALNNLPDQCDVRIHGLPSDAPLPLGFVRSGHLVRRLATPSPDEQS